MRKNTIAIDVGWIEKKYHARNDHVRLEVFLGGILMKQYPIGFWQHLEISSGGLK